MKKRVCSFVDEDIWARAGYELPCSRSEFIERALRSYLETQDGEDDIIKELEEHKAIVANLENKLEDYRKKQENSNKDKEKVEKAMETIERMYANQNNRIGNNQIERIAHINNISSDVILSNLNNYNILTFYDNPRGMYI